MTLKQNIKATNHAVGTANDELKKLENQLLDLKSERDDYEWILDDREGFEQKQHWVLDTDEPLRDATIQIIQELDATIEENQQKADEIEERMRPTIETCRKNVETWKNNEKDAERLLNERHRH